MSLPVSALAQRRLHRGPGVVIVRDGLVVATGKIRMIRQVYIGQRAPLRQRRRFLLTAAQQMQYLDQPAIVRPRGRQFDQLRQKVPRRLVGVLVTALDRGQVEILGRGVANLGLGQVRGGEMARQPLHRRGRFLCQRPPDRPVQRPLLRLQQRLIERLLQHRLTELIGRLCLSKRLRHPQHILIDPRRQLRRQLRSIMLGRDARPRPPQTRTCARPRWQP